MKTVIYNDLAECCFVTHEYTKRKKERKERSHIKCGFISSTKPVYTVRHGINGVAWI